MARWWRTPRWASDNVTAVQVSAGHDHVAVTSAALVQNVRSLIAGRGRLIHHEESWQRELWNYYESCGEYGLAVSWRSNMISRVRLRAAEMRPGLDEPVLLDSGPAVDLVDELFTDVGGKSAAMSTLSTYLDVPGEGWIVGERRGREEVWKTYSSEEIRERGRSGGYEVIDELSTSGRIIWRPLSDNTLIVRVWRPHKRFHHEAFSPAKAARGAIRELELVNRHITAQYLSRLASAGIIVLPDEITFPTREEFNDAPDPFVAEWIATAKQAVESPGTAAAVVPIPMRVPAEYVDKVQHIDFTLKLDEKIIEKREAARRRLAGIINVPTELLFEAGSINHWGLWQLEESGVKTYITPDVELIVNSLTVGYLRPRLQTRGEDPSRKVVWYDASEIISRPNIAENVMKAYDKMEASGRALRRAVGLDEEDKPTQLELENMILKRLAVAPGTGFAALLALTGREVVTVSPSASGTGDVNQPDGQLPVGSPPPADGPPSSDEAQPRTPRNALTAERAAFVMLQANSQHVIEVNGTSHRLKHPLLCAPHLFSCPFSHAVYGGVRALPGTSGDYECTLSSVGGLVVGRRVFPSSDALLLDPPRGTNGVRHQHN